MSADLMPMSGVSVVGAGCREAFVPTAILPSEFSPCTLAGVSTLVSPYRMVRASPRFTLVLATIDGQGRILRGGPQPDAVVGPGDVLVAAAGAEQDYLIHSSSWTIAWLHLEPPWPGPARLVRGWPQAPFLAHALRGIIASADDPPLVHAWSTVVARLLDHLSHEHQLPRLRHLWSQVAEQLHRPWPMEALARLAGLSPAQLHRVCRAEHGCAPGRLLSRLRLERSRLLIEDNDLTLDAIAGRVGYASAFALSKAYRRQFGHSPRA